MSVDIVIKQKGFFKKKLSLKDILMDCFAYGSYDDNYILKPNERAENEVILYHPDHIARGISVVWNEAETNQIGLHMLLPTTCEEIDDFYMLIEHLCHLWKTDSFEQDGEVHSIKEIENIKSGLKDFNYDTMKSFLTEHEDGNFFCAMWPYYFNSKDVMNWLDDHELSNFSKDIHNNQVIDLYYCAQRYYRMNDESILGVYTITATVDTVFPTKPLTPFSCVNFQTGESITANQNIVAFYSLEKEDILGDVPFDDFISEISKKELHEFDTLHFYFDGLTEEEIEQINQKYPSHTK